MTKNQAMANHAKGPTRKTIQDIEQMYKLADQLVGAFCEPDDIEANVEQRLLKTCGENSPAASQQNVIEDPYLKHRWILNVVQDLARYAENEKQTELQECLEDVKFRVAEILFLKECQLVDERFGSTNEH